MNVENTQKGKNSNVLFLVLKSKDEKKRMSIESMEESEKSFIRHEEVRNFPFMHFRCG